MAILFTTLAKWFHLLRGTTPRNLREIYAYGTMNGNFLGYKKW
jgi:hypothetical protein